MRGLIRMLFYGASVFVAYKIGEKSAQLSTIGFYITRTVEPTPGTTITEYIYITPGGELDYTTDQLQATSFHFTEALKLKNVIQKYSPGEQLALFTNQQYLN